MDEFTELKKLVQDTVNMANEISENNVKPLRSKIDNLSTVADKALQKWSEANQKLTEADFEIKRLREVIQKAGQILSKE